MTTNTAQGITSTEHIFATPRGSQTTDGHRSYVSGSRHRERDYWLTSEGAEKQEVVNRRPLGDPRPVRSADLWMNWARNISRAPEKLNATDLVREADNARRAAAGDFLKGMARYETSIERGGQGAELARQFERERVWTQARESELVGAFAVGNRQAERAVSLLGRATAAVRQVVAIQLRQATPMIERASVRTRARLTKLLNVEQRRADQHRHDAAEPEDKEIIQRRSRHRGLGR